MTEAPSSPTTAKKSTFIGSCHCGHIRYTVSYALPSIPTATRCNCTICVKSGYTGIQLTSPSDLTLLSPSSLREPNVRDYKYGSGNVHRYICPKCGIVFYCEGKYTFEGQTNEFWSLNVLTVDQPQEGIDLSHFRIKYWDGRNDNWVGGAKDTPWPGGCV